MREKLSEVLYQLGRYDAALAVLEPAAAALRAAGDLERLGCVAAHIGWMHSLRGTWHAGLALVQPLVGLLERSAASPALPRLFVTLGQFLFAAGRL